MRPAHIAAIFLLAIAGTGCATHIPGADFPKQRSQAYVPSVDDHAGMQLDTALKSHANASAFRMLSVGADGFAARMQITRAARHSLDIQYFIFTADSTGLLLTKAILASADRGVHVRILVDDGATTPGDEQIQVLAAHPNVEVRIFNPFSYRGHLRVVRAMEFTFNIGRLDYRMHNKLFVADNSVALVGGRNVGDAYFQVSTDAQYADDDLFTSGPVVTRLSATFDEFWNSALAIPTQALHGGSPPAATLERHRRLLARHWQDAEVAGVDYLKRAEQGDPLAGMLSGALPLTFANARVVYDSPDKKAVIGGEKAGRLMYGPIAEAVDHVQSEMLMITPYLVPTPEELALLHRLRQRNVRVRILTNSLNSTNELSAHAGYMHYRQQLLADGIELYEVRALLGATSRGSGQARAMSRHGNYGLHAKLFIFDRRTLFVGSMNFDQRSRRLNTEIGVLIDSPELAAQSATRFERMTQPASAYVVSLRSSKSGVPRLVWNTLEEEKPMEYLHEPSRSWRRSLEVRLLSWLPIEREL